MMKTDEAVKEAERISKAMRENYGISSDELGRNAKEASGKIPKFRMFVLSLVGASILFGTTHASAAEKTHTVEAGETMSEIANIHGQPLESVVESNPNIENVNVIFPNQEINIPSESHTATVTDKNELDDETVTKDNSSQHTQDIKHTDGNEALLARLIEAESGGESYEGKVAVGKVVLNRVTDGQFPSNVKAVIHEKGQFDVVANGLIHEPASIESVSAAREAIRQGGNANGALFFYNAGTATNRWLDTRPTVFSIGNHTFKR